MTETRKLSTILFADIAGYTALMQQDEEKAMTLLSLFKHTLEDLVPTHQGQIVQYFGDGCVLAFDSGTNGVECAIALQASFSKDQIPIRIGLHLGDVVFKNNNVFGDGVNIASRIESMGMPGAILVSKAIRDQVINKSEFLLVSLGKFEFKNVGEPMEIFAIANPGFVVPRRDEMKGKLKTKTPKQSRFLIPIISVLSIMLLGFVFKDLLFKSSVVIAPIKSLAILPFENADNDSTLAFLADGIPENLINRLSYLTGVKVYARSATFGLTRDQRNTEQVHTLLNADVILTGQLQKKGNGYFLNCELVDAVNQSLLWGGKFELGIMDVSMIEDSIFRSLHFPLNLDKSHLTSGHQVNVNPEAYTEYLKGRHLSYGSTPEESEKALNHFREAIRIDPKYALAYAAIANEKITQIIFSTASKNEIVHEARMAIDAAKALNPELSDIYSAEGALKFYYDWDWKGAVASYKKALELDPGNANIFIRYSATLAALGQHTESLELADKAVVLDPISRSSLHNLGWTNLLAGNNQASIDAFAKALELHPNWVWGNVKKAYGHIFLGEFDNAYALGRKAEELLNGEWGSELLQSVLFYIYTACNKPEDAQRVLNRFLTHTSENTIVDPYAHSVVSIFQGDYAKAIVWETRCVDEKHPSSYLLNIPIFYNGKFFNSPEHQKLLSRMGH